MRKILAVLLCAVMLLSMFAFSGCGDSVFSGKYKEVSYQEFCDYVKLIENSKEIELEKFCVKENEKEVVKVKNGNKNFYAAYYIYPHENENNNCYYCSYVDDALHMQGNSEEIYKNNYTNSKDESRKDFYYEDGILYSIDSTEKKGYKNSMGNLRSDFWDAASLNNDDFLLYMIKVLDSSGESRFYTSIYNAKSNAETNENVTVNYSFCKMDNCLKYKVEATQKATEDNIKQTISVSIISVYELKDNSDYRFTAGQYVEEWNEDKSYKGFSATVKTSERYSVSLEPYDGSVDIPQEVKLYEENEKLRLS